MAKFQISNPVSGLILGTYEAASSEDALEALARDAGYKSMADAAETTGEDGSQLTVKEVE
jgi:hypothetical protein